MADLPTFAAPLDGRLNAKMLSAFDDTGVIILREFAEPAACATLRAHTVQMVERDAPEAAESIFSTKTNSQLSDDYFIKSGGNISFFFEEETRRVSAQNVSGGDRAKMDRLNKIGHAMHDLDPVFDAFSRTAKLAAAAASLGFKDPKLVQSMYIVKPPGIGGEVVCHQDSTYLYTEPQSCVGFWFAIDEATEANGCMEFLPGTHKGPLRELNSRRTDGKLSTRMIDETPFPEVEPVPAPAMPGDLVIFHGRAPHMSAANRSNEARHAYTLHVVEGSSRWPAENWLQRPPELPFRGF
ncbi:MAG: phytanoyl-CoA dioxygenase family protein [Pseudomonadota bacterium]